MNIENYSQNFAIYLHRLGYAESTIKHAKGSIERFLSHLQSQSINQLKEVQPIHLNAYNEYLHSLKSKLTGRGLHSHTIQANINVLKQFSQFLELTEQIKIYTIKLSTAPSIKQHRNILTQSQIKQLYQACDDSITGLRNKTLLGLYYGCGLRYREGISLETSHIDYKKEVLYIAPGKNYKSRFVPVNTSVLKDFRDYESYAKSCFKQRGACFLSGNCANETLNKVLQNLCEQANVSTLITLHSLRHSIATHLLQEQMPLEQIAKFLGHTTLRATEMYTRILFSE